MGFAMALTLNKKLVTLVSAILLLTACSEAEQTESQVIQSATPTPNIRESAADCNNIQNEIYRLQNSAKELQRMFAEELTLKWTRLMINNRKCFSNDEYCAAIDLHNSLEEGYRQESSTWCMG